MLRQHPPIVSGSVDDEDHHSGARIVTPLRLDPPLHTLRIVHPGLALHGRDVGAVIDSAVPCPEITLDRDRNLATKAQRRREQRFESTEEGKLRDVVDRGAIWVELHRWLESNRARGAAQLVKRWPHDGVPFDAAELGSGEAGSSACDLEAHAS